jgi:hypothetical protein
MKKTLSILVFITLLLFTQKTEAVLIKIKNDLVHKGINIKSKNFKRLYSNFSVKRNANQLKKEDDISITFEDFLEHFEIGKNRILSGVPTDVTMNIGNINSGSKETWVLPNLSAIPNFTSIVINQLDAKETDLYDSFGYGSHVLYSEDLGIRELYDLTDFDLYFVGYSEIEGQELVEYQYDQTKAPIPIELGLEYESVVNFADDELNFVEYTDTYYVIGQGTLKTFDEGDVDAMKMIYREVEKVVENGVEISNEERYEIVFYSKKGHYVTADITDPWNNEGEVTLSNMNYHKLESKTASVNDNFSENVKKLSFLDFSEQVLVGTSQGF